jgi:hypothetical protein
VNGQSLKPALILRLVEKHVPLVRLLIVAAADDLIFTMEEFNHLEACSECFTTWTEFIGVRGHEPVN